MSLVVIHYNYNVVPAAKCFTKYRIWRSWCFFRNVDSFCKCLINGRLNFFNFFSSEHTIFTAVWIQACNTDLRLLDTKCLTTFICNADNIEDSFLLAKITCLTEGYVCAYMDDTQLIMCKHHGVFCCMCIVCIYFGMSGVMMTGHIDVVFIQCVGNGGIYFTGHCQLDSFLYILESSFTAHGHAFFVCCVKNVCLHYLCQLLSVFLIQTFGKIYDIQIININDSWLKFCFLYTMDHIDLHALSTLDSWDCCFHALCISNNKRSANFISLWLH